MSQTIDVNGQSINYPETGDTNWGDEATDFAVQTSAALGKLGLASGTSVDIAQTLDVTGNTTLDANLSVGGDTFITGNTTLTGNITVNGNSNLGNGTSDTTAITGILNVDSGVLYVDPTNSRVGINDTTPSEALDVTGNALISGTLGVSGNTTIDGVTYLDDDTTANTPVLSFTGDTNTGIGHSAADTLDFITGGVSRFRIQSTGQIQAVVPSGSTFYPGYLCRAWVNFDGTGTFSPNPSTTKIRASGNVSSITKNGTGDYTINFITAMPDVNYSIVGSNIGDTQVNAAIYIMSSGNANTINSSRINTRNSPSNTNIDPTSVNIMVIR